jgi:hypothetical protein
MTPAKVLAQFERHYLQEKAPSDLEHVCAGLAQWLASAWDLLDEEERTRLIEIGAWLWRESFSRTAGSGTGDPW